MVYLIALVAAYLTGTVCGSVAPPVQKWTTVTLYLDSLTWNDAVAVCQARGGKILDITYFSMFGTMLYLSNQMPWVGVPIENGPPAWIGLHRQVTVLGDRYYSQGCRSLDEFKIQFWNTADSYHIMDGPASSYCVYHQIIKTVAGSLVSYMHDYTRADCSEKHRFYCQHESGPCTFEKISGFSGDSSSDFSPANDVEYPYSSDEDCTQLCLNTSDIYPHPDMLVVEECWGFTTTLSTCRLHIVLRANYFDMSSHKQASATSTLFIKRCFQAAVNDDVFEATNSTSELPHTSCGIPQFDNTTSVSLEVELYTGKWTWNEAFTTCQQRGMTLLNTNTYNKYIGLQMLQAKYSHVLISSTDIFWLGVHEPDPAENPGIMAWSDCQDVTDTRWDTSSPPSNIFTDTSLCTILNASSTLWYTAPCNQRQSFICTGSEGSVWEYDFGSAFTIGQGENVGPFEDTNMTCREKCSTFSYKQRECWAYAVRTDVTACFLYFTQDSTFQKVEVASTVDQFVLYRKQLWKDVVYSSTDVEANTDIFPVSCCYMDGIRSICPVNSLPQYESNIPSTVKQQLVLHTLPSTWSGAIDTCKSYGGTLLQVDNVSKWYMLQRFIKRWTADLFIVSDIWIGLSVWRASDPCAMRWSGGCNTVMWTEFGDDGYKADAEQKCGAVTTAEEFTKRYCNETLPFICQINVGDCDTMETVYDIGCPTESPHVTKYISIVTSTTCIDTCMTSIQNGMECWAFTKTRPTTCYLYFDTDPDYCRDNPVLKNNYQTTFKSCYTSSVNTSTPLLGSSNSLLPSDGCSLTLVYPYVRNDSVCTTISLSTSAYSTLYSSSVTDLSVADTLYSSSMTTLSVVDTLYSSSMKTLSVVDTIYSSSMTDLSVADTLASSTSSSYLVSSYASSQYSTKLIPSTYSEMIITSSPLMTETSMSSLLTLSTESAMTHIFTTSASGITVTLSSQVTITSTISPTSSVTTSSVLVTPTVVSTQEYVPLYVWPCLCHISNITNISMEEWQESMIQSSIIPKQNTTKYQRSLSSVYEHRTSTMTIGIGVSSLIICFAIYIAITDIPKVWKGIRFIHRLDSNAERYTLKNTR